MSRGDQPHHSGNPGVTWLKRASTRTKFETTLEALELSHSELSLEYVFLACFPSDITLCANCAQLTSNASGMGGTLVTLITLYSMSTRPKQAIS